MKNQTDQALISFIVVGWNNKLLLAECFNSIKSQTYKNYSVIYVDNGSTDDSVAYVNEHYPEIIIIDIGKNLGFAIGNNKGIRKAFEDKKCKYVALLNTDARIAEDWAEQLVTFADKHSGGASYQSPTLDYYDHAILDSSGIKLDTAGRAIQLGYRQPLQPIKTHQVFGINAAAGLYSRQFLDQQPFGEDYFDSDMWMYLEDVDLAARATMMGWQNWYVNKSSAYHMGSASSSKNPGFSTYMIYRNNLPVLIKNLPLDILLRITPKALFAELFLLMKLARYRNIAALKAVIKGRVKCLPMLPTFFRKRRVLKKCRAISRADLLALMKEDL